MLPFRLQEEQKRKASCISFMVSNKYSWLVVNNNLNALSRKRQNANNASKFSIASILNSTPVLCKIYSQIQICTIYIYL